MKKEEAKEILSRPFNMKNVPQDILEAHRMAIKALEQEPKKGHWILDETDNSRTCSNCNCQLWTSDILRGDACYCPNCGAKMDGVEA